MVRAVSRSMRGCALVVATLALAGCGRVVVGVATPWTDDNAASVPIADLLIAPEQFPAGYPAAVLDATAVHRALQDISGVPAGAVVRPADCAPTPLAAQHTVAAQGIDTDDAASLIVAVTRGAPSLRGRVGQLRDCASFTAVRGKDTTEVTVTLLPAPPVDADDSAAIDQTVRSSMSTRRMLSFVAQIGDTRVSATWLKDSGPGDLGEPDTASLDAVFASAVLKVRRAG